MKFNSECDVFVQTFKTWDAFQEFTRLFPTLKGDAGDFQEIMDLQNTQADRLLHILTEKVLDEELWHRLSQDPAKFRSELEETLGLISRTMTWRYGMPAHRKTKNAERDRRIYHLREAGRSFGQIKAQVKLPSEQAARQAYDRYRERQEKILRKWCEIARQIETATPQQKTRLVSEWLEFARCEKLYS